MYGDSSSSSWGDAAYEGRRYEIKTEQPCVISGNVWCWEPRAVSRIVKRAA